MEPGLRGTAEITLTSDLFHCCSAVTACVERHCLPPSCFIFTLQTTTLHSVTCACVISLNWKSFVKIFLFKLQEIQRDTAM